MNYSQQCIANVEGTPIKSEKTSVRVKIPARTHKHMIFSYYAFLATSKKHRHSLYLDRILLHSNHKSQYFWLYSNPVQQRDFVGMWLLYKLDCNQIHEWIDEVYNVQKIWTLPLAVQAMKLCSTARGLESIPGTRENIPIIKRKQWSIGIEEPERKTAAELAHCTSLYWWAAESDWFLLFHLLKEPYISLCPMPSPCSYAYVNITGVM